MTTLWLLYHIFYASQDLEELIFPLFNSIIKDNTFVAYFLYTLPSCIIRLYDKGFLFFILAGDGSFTV